MEEILAKGLPRCTLLKGIVVAWGHVGLGASGAKIPCTKPVTSAVISMELARVGERIRGGNIRCPRRG